MAGNKPIKKRSKTGSFFRMLLLAIVSTIATVVIGVFVLLYIANISDLRKEKEQLEEVVESLKARESPDTVIVVPEQPGHVSEFDMEMRRINPDYICWITIDGTMIDYPVVRGTDNEKYLGTSFYGEENILGTLFMDYRCAGNIVPHIIIYGHNSRLGDLFGTLREFLEEEYIERHPVIILKENDRIIEYEIFAARRTTVHDPAYDLDFSAPGSFGAFAVSCGAPADATQIITLSTCYSGDDADERVIVQGMLRG